MWKTASIILLTAQLLVAGEGVELTGLSTPLDLIPENFPRTVSSSLTASTIALLPETTGSIVDGDIRSILDTDRTTGVTLSPNCTYSFLISLQTISRVDRVVLTGPMQGGFVSIQMSQFPIDPGTEGWKSAVNHQPLQSPGSAFDLRPAATFRAIVNIETGGEPAKLSDISLYSAEDVRSVRLGAEGNMDQAPPETPLTEEEMKSVETQYDLASMYSGAQVTYTSSISHPDEANAINDDNANTYCRFSPNAKESIVALDLGSTRRARKISVVHSKQPGTLFFHVMDALPWTAGGRHAALAWLERASDALLTFQLAPSISTLQPTVELDSATFSKWKPFATIPTDGGFISQATAPVTTGHFLIVRFSNEAPDAQHPFQIHDLHLFGDYPPRAFALNPHPLPEWTTDALITAPPKTSPPPGGTPDVRDPSQLGNSIPPDQAIPPPPPPAASPTIP